MVTSIAVNLLQAHSRYDNDKLLKLCSDNNLHTIKPTLYLNNNIYTNIKNNLSNSIIISIEINKYTEKELSTSIDYIRGKGYKLVTLDKLINENYN